VSLIFKKYDSTQNSKKFKIIQVNSNIQVTQLMQVSVADTFVSHFKCRCKASVSHMKQ